MRRNITAIKGKAIAAVAIFAALFVFLPGEPGVSAQDVRDINTIEDEILENQGVRRIGNVNPNEVDPMLLEELGTAVMDEAAGDQSHREWMEQMMGGADSPELAEAYRWMGYRYLLAGGSLRDFARGPGMMGYGWGGTWDGEGWTPRDRGPWGPRRMPRWRRDMLGNRSAWGGYGMPGPWVPAWVWVVGIGLVVGIIVLLVLLLRRNGTGTRRSSALDILRSRYARGEISREEFQRMKSDLS